MNGIGFADRLRIGGIGVPVRALGAKRLYAFFAYVSLLLLHCPWIGVRKNDRQQRVTPMKAPQTPKLLRSDQVLEKLHAFGLTDLDDGWLNNMCRNRSIPFTKVGKFRRFREDAIDTMVERWAADAR